MGKIRTKLIGLEEVEKKQKEDAKKRIEGKKLKKSVSVKTAVDKKRSVNAEKIFDEPKKEIDRSVKLSKPIKLAKLVQTTKTHGKKYQELKKLVDKTKLYDMKEAITLLKKLKTAKFDESVEMHLNVDKTGLKGEVDLPHATGKAVRVAVVSEAVLMDIQKGKIDFDILVTHPSFMPRLAKFAKVLGPKGLMPNPKAGTISERPEEVLKKFQKGVLRWKTEPKFPLIHQMIGKISFDEKSLLANAEKFIEAVGKTHIKKAFIKTTMSPVVNLEIVK